MNQLYNMALDMMQTTMTDLPKVGKTSGENTGSEFRDLLEQQQNQTQTKPTESKPAEKAPASEKAPTKQQKEEEAPDYDLAQEIVRSQIVMVEPVIQVEAAEEAAAPELVEASVEGVVESLPKTFTQMAAPEAEMAVELQQPELDDAAAPEAELSDFAQVVTQPAAEQPAQSQTQEQPEMTLTRSDAPAEQEGQTESKSEEEVTVETPLFQNVEAAPIKVAEAPARVTETAEAEPVETQVEARLVSVLDNGDTHVEIQLTPENLGHVTIDVTRSGDGSIHIALQAENTHTRGLLESHASHLQSLLADRGQSVEVEVRQPQEGQQNQGQHEAYDGQNGHNGGRQQEQRRQQSHDSGEDFLQQLRLGLVPTEEIL